MTVSSALRKGDIVTEAVACMPHETRDVVVQNVRPGLVWYPGPDGEWDTHPVYYVRGTDTRNGATVVWTRTPHFHWNAVTRAAQLVAA